VFVANVDSDSFSPVVKIAAKLRKKGIKCEIDLMNRNLTKQLEYADAVGVRYVIIAGKKELSSGKLKFKDMKNKTEDEMTIGEIVSKLKKLQKMNKR